MQKKLLAVAVAGALGAPAVAMAQTSTVQMFGTFYVEYGYARQDRFPGGVAPFNDRQNIDVYGNPGSELGIKGEEKLGGGLSAWFQCTATMNFLDGGGGNGGDDDGLLCSRNSALGMKGGFGNLFIGRWDAPFKRTISPTNVGGNDTGVWGTAMLLTGGSTSTLPGTARSTFKRREGNMMFYDSPNFGGFQVLAGISSAQGTNPAQNVVGTGATEGATASKPRTLSLGAQYSAGPLYISAGYERHNEFGGAGVAGASGELDDKGWHVGAAYTWGPVRFGGQYTEQKFDIAGLGAPGALRTDAKARAFHVGVDWRIVGPHGLRAAYTRARDMKGDATNIAAVGAAVTNVLPGIGTRPAPCVGPTFATRVCGDTGADMWQVRYVYTFSKRTEFNLGYSKVDNDANASYVQSILQAPARGGDTSIFAASLRHTF